MILRVHTARSDENRRKKRDDNQELDLVMPIGVDGMGPADI